MGLFFKDDGGMIIMRYGVIAAGSTHTSYGILTEKVKIDEEFNNSNHCPSVAHFLSALGNQYEGQFITVADKNISISKARRGNQYSYKYDKDMRLKADIGFRFEDTERKPLGVYTYGKDPSFEKELLKLSGLSENEVAFIRNCKEYENLATSRLYGNVREAFLKYIENDKGYFTYKYADNIIIKNKNSFQIIGIYGDSQYEIANFGNRALTNQELLAFSCLLHDRMPEYFSHTWETVIVNRETTNGRYKFFLRSYLIPEIKLFLKEEVQEIPPDDGIY